MRYRRFGRTELQMPVFSCGGMRYQDKGADRPIDQIDPRIQDALEQTIRRAVDLGINHIETARGYGCSERQLGYILPKLPREKIIVQTKNGPKDDPQQFYDEVKESITERLQLDYIDLFGLHGLNDRQSLDRALRPGGCFEAAQQLRDEGLIRFIGFSTHGLPEAIMEAIEFGEPEVGKGLDYVNLHWYYIFQRNWQCIERARQRDMGVFIISPTDKGGRLWAPSEKLCLLTRPLHPIVFNDLFCLSHPEVHTLSIGAARPTDFDLHLHALPRLEDLDDTRAAIRPMLDNLDTALRDAMGDLADPYAAGLPDWDRTPGEINLPVIVQMMGLVRAFDMIEYAKSRYNLLGNGGSWFPGQSAEQLDEHESAIRDLLTDRDDVDTILALLREADQLLAGRKRQRLTQA